ncbi:MULTISPECIES: hypothetical protein [unclassified Streptomyces]|uniref:hypothetical protein n=1 Tax=unclassified Streptomyces TaxID=2593676 RepID=UPI001BAF2BA2|nr:hypothetical protein [Streptomyces sp. V17-9]QUW89887.1 hypothetical protein KE639_01063 [Streptomyces sp. V17-9]
MTANPLTVSEQATAGSAAAARQQLEKALEEAGFLAPIEAADDGASLRVTMYSSKCRFADSVEDATEWLHQSGIDATAALDEKTFRVVMTLPSADSVRMFIAALLQPWITARTTAAALADVLSDHGLDCTIDVGTASLCLLVTDDELDAAVLLARLLGAPDIGTDLPRHRPRGIRRLTERVRWLITGVVGSPVSTEIEYGCAHEADRLTIELTLEQARRLTQRLLLAEVADPSARLQRLLGKTVGAGAGVTTPGHAPGSDRYTITLDPEQARRLTHRLDPDLDVAPARGLTTH